MLLSLRSDALSLPIDPMRGAVCDALNARERVVVTAPTGSGKSTRVPLWANQATDGGRVLVIEPRRVACRSLARYVASQTGATLGEQVGYAVRYDARFAPSTRVVFATPGIVLQRMQARSGDERGFLGSWDALVLDEFHERHIETDLILAFALELGLERLVLMSATLEAERLARHVKGALVEGQGRMYPVTVEHAEAPPLPTNRDLERRVAAAVERVLDDHAGDVLVFLPGKGEIQGTMSALSGIARRHDLDILPLHGALPPDAQDAAFSPGPRRRVILATNVAETSVTLPRIGVVIDAGLVRQTRYHRGEGVLRLTEIAQDSAEQRKGRAGRLGPGHCVRLWSERAKLDPVTRPEILREDLTDTVLRVAACGFVMRKLPLLDAPPSYAIQAAADTLHRLECLDSDGHITDTGRHVAALPIPAHLARPLTLIQADSALDHDQRVAALRDAADLIAALAAGRSFFLPARKEPSEARKRWRASGCDATAAILALRHGKPHQDGLHPAALAEARKLAAQLRQRLGLPKTPPGPETTPDRRVLARVWIQADSRTAFARRLHKKKRDAFSNQGSEVLLARESRIQDTVEAIVVIDTHTLRDARGRITHLATCAIPSALPTLHALGLGKPEVQEAKVRGGKLVCDLRLRYAGRTLSTSTEIPTGDAAREGLRRVLGRGHLFGDTVSASLDHIALWNLYIELEGLQGAEPVDAEAWLDACVEALGFEAGDELELLVEDDFVFTWPQHVPDYALEAFQRNYPMHLDLGDQKFDVQYRPGRRVVTLVQTQGRKSKPSLRLLPGWGGWQIRVQRGSSVSVLRER